MNDYEAYEPGPVIPVHIRGSDVALAAPPALVPKRYGESVRAFLFTANDPIQEVLPLNGRRCKAFVQAAGSPVTLYSSKADALAAYSAVTRNAGWPDGGSYASGVVAAPAAGQTIATITAANLPAGRYLLRINAGFGGNAEATTDFNVDVVAGTTVIMGRLMVTAASNNVRTWVFDNVALDGNSALKVVAHANASASAVYVADITATPIVILPPTTGGIVVAASNTAWTPLPTTDPVWATSQGPGAVLSVLAVIED